MAAQTTNYQCPACTGPLHFAGNSGKLECEYCGSAYEVAEIEKLYSQKDEAAVQAMAAEKEKKETAANNDGWDCSDCGTPWEASGMSAYNCTSCGADLVCDNSTAATTCPYCGNPTIIPGQFSGMLKPDYVIPFKVTKDEALATLKKHYGGKKLLPKLFSKENHLQEVQGIYVPFWLFDGEADAQASYEGLNSVTHRKGNYEITDTSHFNVFRAGTVKFEKIPVDASTKMDDDLMDSIEPYDYSELTKFSNAYLPGYLADKFDVSAEDCSSRADERAENTALSALRNTVINYEMVHTQGQNANLRRGKVHYALMPVWLLTTNWNGKKYTFAMNGQTGKMVGDLPMDKSLFWKWQLIWTGILGAAVFVIGTIVSFM